MNRQCISTTENRIARSFSKVSAMSIDMAKPLFRRLRSALMSSGMALVSSVILPSAAWAHPFHEHSCSFGQGFFHPFAGVDHLVMMLVVGVLAAQSKNHARYLLPLGFVFSMALGLVSSASLASPLAYDGGIALSLIIAGIALCRPQSSRSIALLALASATGFFHGGAHGIELGMCASSVQGIILGTTILHATGFFVAAAMSNAPFAFVQRITAASGFAVLTFGVASGLFSAIG